MAVALPNMVTLYSSSDCTFERFDSFILQEHYALCTSVSKRENLIREEQQLRIDKWLYLFSESLLPKCMCPLTPLSFSCSPYNVAEKNSVGWSLY